MTINPHKSVTNVEDLSRLSNLVAKMPGSTKGDVANPPGGTDEPVHNIDPPILPTGGVGSGVIAPTPNTDKSTKDRAINLSTNPEEMNITRRSRRVPVKPKTPKSGTTPSESMPPWFLPHLYPPWYPSPFHYPYAAQPAPYTPQLNPQAIPCPCASKQPTRFCSCAAETRRDNPENNKPVQTGQGRTVRNLLTDFDQEINSNEERNEFSVAGGDGGSGDDGNGNDDGDEDWRGDSSEECEEESDSADEITSDIESTSPNEGPIRTRHKDKGSSSTAKRNHRQPTLTRETRATVDMAVIRDMVRKGVARELAGVDVGKGKSRKSPINVDKGPLSKHIYWASMVDFKYPATLPNFRGSGDTQDPHNFVHSYQERLRFLGATDPSMCRIFTTCLSGEAWDCLAVPSENSNTSQRRSWRGIRSSDLPKLHARCCSTLCRNPENELEHLSTDSSRNPERSKT